MRAQRAWTVSMIPALSMPSWSTVVMSRSGSRGGLDAGRAEWDARVRARRKEQDRSMGVGIPDAPSTAKPVEDYRELYTQVCESYRAIDDFRMKLLGLLPVATGAGVLALLNSGKVDLNASGSTLERMQQVLAGVAIFGVAITLGLFAYELHGIKKCGRLIKIGARIEKDMGSSGRFYGQFATRPHRVAGFIDVPFASSVVYPAAVAVWVFVGVVALSGCERNAAERLARVRRDYTDGKIDADDWRSFRDELESEHAAAQAKVRQLATQADRVREAAALLTAEDDVLLRIHDLHVAVTSRMRAAATASEAQLRPTSGRYGRRSARSSSRSSCAGRRPKTSMTPRCLRSPVSAVCFWSRACGPRCSTPTPARGGSSGKACGAWRST
jgi:hypothetical protein